MLRFEVFSVFLGTFCVERYQFQDGREIVDLLKSPESVKKTHTYGGIGLCLWVFHALYTFLIDLELLRTIVLSI